MNIKQIICVVVTIFVLVIGFLFLPSQATSVELGADSFLRIHIRANSNQNVDQQVKYKVKDELVKYLTPILAEANSKSDAMNLVKENLENLSNVASLVLFQEGYNYTANAKLTSEYFPTRCYDDVVLESGEYDSLIINLGSGSGNNWWCVVYPPLCFVATDDSSEGITYRSKIFDIIRNFFGG